MRSQLLLLLLLQRVLALSQLHFELTQRVPFACTMKCTRKCGQKAPSKLSGECIGVQCYAERLKIDETR